MSAFVLAFDGDGYRRVQYEGSDDERLLETVQGAARDVLRETESMSSAPPVLRLGQWTGPHSCPSPTDFVRSLLDESPVNVDVGFEGNPGVEGGVWPSHEGQDDALLYLRFVAGTLDLPLHVHQFSDRMILVAGGIGLFHYGPAEERVCELRSVVVDQGDAIMFRRGLLHTFTAPITDLVLLSFHAPFFALDDPRQFTVPASTVREQLAWRPAELLRGTKSDCPQGMVV